MFIHCFFFMIMVFWTAFPMCSAFQSPKRFTSVSFPTRLDAAANIPLVFRSQTTAVWEQVVTNVSSLFQTHLKSKMIVLGNIFASIVVQLIPFALLFCLYQSIMFFVSLGKKKDEPQKQVESTSNVIEVSDSEVRAGVPSSVVTGLQKEEPTIVDPSNRPNTKQLLIDEKDRFVRMEQAKIDAASDIRRIAEEEAREQRIKAEKEAKKKEEAYQQQARLSRFKQQRAAEKAAQYSYSTPPVVTGTDPVTTIPIGSDGIMKREDNENEKDALGAAVLTAALVGLKLGGPLGALIGAGSVNYFGKKTATKGVIRDTGNAAIGTVDLLKSVDEKFAVVRGVEKALLDALKGSSKDKDASSKFQQSYEQTKTAFGASIPVGKDMLGATMDVTDMFFGKMEELQTMNVAKDNSSTSTSDNDGSENSDVKNTS